MATTTNDFKVIIVGGSIAGLTLAHCLQKGGIDFVVLEAREEIAPQVGASIGILSNGARILDQLGLWDGINELIDPLKRTTVWTEEGTMISQGDNGEMFEKRFGYPVAFLDRQLVLKVLADKTLDTSKIKLGAKVIRVDHSANGVLVHCKDGTSYAGDIVAGADGIHSTIRREMWRYCDNNETREFIESDKTALFSEYRCLFGISAPVKGLQSGESHRAYGKGWSSLVVIGKEQRCFWFLFEKLDRRYLAHEIPRYDKQDENKLTAKFKNRFISGDIKFNALWKNKITAHLVSLEEAQHKHWTIGRFVCLGDSIHKMTPNLGQGGNSAIESAAALANQLFKVRNSRGKNSLVEIKDALENYQKDRQPRAGHIFDTANSLTRLEAMDTTKDKILGRYILPHMSNFLIDQTSDTLVGATKINFLPEPARSLTGTMPFNASMGVGQKENKFWRCLYALPLLGAGLYTMHLLSTVGNKSLTPIVSAYLAGAIPSSNGTSTAIRATYYGLPEVDMTIKRYVLAFTPSIAGMDQAHRYQVMAFMADLIPVQVIWAIESARVGNYMTIASIFRCILECIYQWKGIGIFGPLYYFLHYIQSPQENYHAADNRAVPVVAVKAIMIAIALGYAIPTFAMFSTFLSVDTRQLINGVWQTFPIWTALLSYIFQNTTTTGANNKDTTVISNYNLTYIRGAYFCSGFLSALTYVYIRSTSPIPLSQIFFSDINSPYSTVSSLIEGFCKFLRYDQISAFGSGLFWQLLHFKDLKAAGKLNSGWHKILGVLGITTLLFGPGAAMALGWAWREEVMAGTKWAML